MTFFDFLDQHIVFAAVVLVPIALGFSDFLSRRR